MAYRITTLGDSIAWGQGLLEEQKYDVLVRNRLAGIYPEVTLDTPRLSHSGAVIWRATEDPHLNGEIPDEAPTVAFQVRKVTAPETVDLLLIDGGINDVGVENILNPLIGNLHSRVKTACYDEMLELLRRVTVTFTKPTCRIIVTGYYQILSDKSDPLQFGRLMSHHGLNAAAFGPPALFRGGIIGRCAAFYRQSDDMLASAVHASGDNRIQFVSSGFTEDNAVFAGQTSLLFGLDQWLLPEDPVAGERRAQCDLTYRNPLDFARREQCYRASAGHPNPAGARQYAKQILAALGVV